MSDTTERQQIRVPLPAVPLPLTFFFGIAPLGQGEGVEPIPVIFCTAVNDAGSMTQGFMAAETANKIGRDLMGAARQAFTMMPAKLIVPANAGELVVPV